MIFFPYGLNLNCDPNAISHYQPYHSISKQLNTNYWKKKKQNKKKILWPYHLFILVFIESNEHSKIKYKDSCSHK